MVEVQSVVGVVVVAVVVVLMNVERAASAMEEWNCTKDEGLLEFALNLEYMEAEWFLNGALGYGLDQVAPNLAMGGPPPSGARIANLDPFTRDLISQFAFQEFGHLRAIKERVKGFPRPHMDLSGGAFAKVMDEALGMTLVPSFDPYSNPINFLLASYLVPYVGLTGYVGSLPNLQCPSFRKLVGGLLAVESGQDAVIREMLYEKARLRVVPYGVTVAAFTSRISSLRNRLGKAGSSKDEGLIVEREGRVRGNVLVGDEFSLAYARSPEEILRIVYGSGNESVVGGFFPRGCDGKVARSYLPPALH
ncbi:PREDICTED: desiccation-related protein PCC13-62 [Tarenaya hassleriana]|uniref:desiccation-related protein PCC13-62 n=1 Tax=Tarenaya hassleriana TaxID=28532 RepID=UPI00053C4745|nr:PREDICTED: desiccation-related protein PCC13-62 [Tarenaya hassleriana]